MANKNYSCVDQNTSQHIEFLTDTDPQLRASVLRSVKLSFRLPEEWSTSSGAGRGGRSLRSTLRQCRCFPEALPGGTEPTPGSFSQRLFYPRCRPDGDKQEFGIAVQVWRRVRRAGFVAGKTNLLLGSEHCFQVLQHHWSVRTVGETDPVKGHQAFARPIGRRTLLSFPGCFALQFGVLHHSFHRRHLRTGDTLTVLTEDSYLGDDHVI